MDKITTMEGDLNARDARFTIVASRFNDFIVESLIKGAVSCLRRHGAADSNLEIIRVPGAYEMPLAALLLLTWGLPLLVVAPRHQQKVPRIFFHFFTGQDINFLRIR